jgi:hypothetical protein
MSGRLDSVSSGGAAQEQCNQKSRDSRGVALCGGVVCYA